MNSIEAYIKTYIGEVIKAADLVPWDARRVCAELDDHLQEIIAISRRNNMPGKEVMVMVEREFGKPEELGDAIARARGRFRTYLKKGARRWPIEIAVAVVLAVVIRAVAIEGFRVATDAASPAVLKGNRVLVNKLSSTFQENDVVVYIERNVCKMGVVKESSANEGKVVISRNEESDRTINANMIRGRVFLQLRL